VVDVDGRKGDLKLAAPVVDLGNLAEAPADGADHHREATFAALLSL
jgi:hypothetical protein